MRQALFLLILSLTVRSNVFAVYTLQYPSYMPGHKLYWVARAIDGLKKYWFWGSIASVRYHLMLADQYLVEAKTLFEYKQYFLGVEALKRSNEHIPLIAQSLASAAREEKDTQKLRETVIEAMSVHIEILDRVSKDLPTSYQWTPEKQVPTTINFLGLFEEAKKVRTELLK